MKFSIYQESRIGKRSNNEDRLAYCYSWNALLIVIADGMGGHHYGEIAAKIAIQTLVTAFQREATPSISNPLKFLEEKMLNAHHAIVAFALKHRLSDMPRTTCVACLIQDNTAYWAHAGDSRLYLIRNGKIMLRTRDHSRLQLLLDQGAISASHAATHPDRNKIYCSLGGPSIPEVELSRQISMEAGDIVLLCTDGLWGPLSEDFIINTLKEDDLHQSASWLLGYAEKQAGNNADNLSLIVVRWNDNAVEKVIDTSSYISTIALNSDIPTITRTEILNQDSPSKYGITDDEIEQVIEEIRLSIQKRYK